MAAEMTLTATECSLSRGWPVLSPTDRQQYWEWCREHIDRQAIWRASKELPGIPGKAKGSTYTWQFYLKRATYNPDFAHRLGLLFWDHFLPQWQQGPFEHPFQLGGCQPSGSRIVVILQRVGASIGVKVNAFLIRRQAKSIGIDNFFDGRVLPDVPVLLVDDLSASAPFLLHASARIQSRLHLPLFHSYFTIVDKVGRGFGKSGQHTENYLDNQRISLFTMNNFCKTAQEFRVRYGEDPKWAGIVA